MCWYQQDFLQAVNASLYLSMTNYDNKCQNNREEVFHLTILEKKGHLIEALMLNMEG